MNIISNTISNIQMGIKKKLRFFMIEKSFYVIEVLKILEKESIITGYLIGNKKVKVFLNLKIKNISLKAVSKQGNRVYQKQKLLEPVNQGAGFYLVSTTKGILTDVKAKSLNVGGEVLCKVYWN